jgi:DUF4097 and DUF4098 domain-containing protein YvlB
MYRYRFFALSLALPVAILSLTGCDELHIGDMEKFREDFRYSYPMKSGARLSVETFNGAIEITGWEKEEIEINGTKYANTKDRLEELKVDIQQTGDSVTVRVLKPSDRRGNAGARFNIRLPYRAVLDAINTSNGSVRIDGVEGRAVVKTSNGAVRAIRLKGDLNATTSNGSVELSELTGAAVVKTSNGGIRGEIVKGSLEAESSNGGIQVRLRESDPAKPVRAETSNGSIELSLDQPREVRAHTSNSSITVRLPANTNASLRARTSNASITSDFDVTLKGGKVSKTNIEGPLGSGGPVIDLSSSNGSIRILRQ